MQPFLMSFSIFSSIKKAPFKTAPLLVNLGSVDLSRLNLQQSVWYLGKAAPM